MQMPAVAAKVLPGEKADAARDDQAHDGTAHQGVPNIICKRGKGSRGPHQVESGVAEGGDGVEEAEP